MSIINCLNMNLTKNFNNERLDYINGTRPLRNYKRNLPIPFRAGGIHQFHQPPDERFFRFRLFHLPMRTYLGSDIGDKRPLLEQLARNEIQLHTSSLIIDGKKLFWMASFEMPKEQHALDTTITARAELSIECPITVIINNNRCRIGSKEEFLYRRLALQAAQQRVQKAGPYNRAGHGRKRKLKTAYHYADAEKKYVSNRLHVYSRRLIDHCVKHRAGTLLLVNQQANEVDAQEDPFLLRNWSYYQLKEKIKYKAEKAGITLIEE